jgi:hypothetical protein
MSLADLTCAAWTVVARQVRGVGPDHAWDWALSGAEIAALRRGREQGVFLTAQRRDPDGWVLVARRARVAPPVRLGADGRVLRAGRG